MDVSINIEGPNCVRIGLHPMSGKMCRPYLGGIVGTELIHLPAQTAHFRNSVQSHHPAKLTRWISTQLLDRLNAAQGHEGKQYKNVKAGIIALDLAEQFLHALQQTVHQ